MVSRREFEKGIPEDYLSHKDKYEESVRKSVIVFGHVRKMQKAEWRKFPKYRYVLDCFLGSSTMRDGSPFAIHFMMFMPAIMSLATEEQQDRWMPRAWEGNIIGSYAQTELGHGTFVRGLETLATYDNHTKEFVLHSPTITSYKWWPGGLGHTANYAVVMAQLHTNGLCHGVHAFIVQLRDEETHKPLPGIILGDMGVKMGLQPVNNGFLAFNNVKIPRIHMLMKHAQVLEDGTYIRGSNNKMMYAAMLFVRVLIVADMGNYLSKAVTIATRYSAVRRQTSVKEGGQELQILDYATQQHKLFIGIATCYVFRIVANRHWSNFNEVTDEVANGNLTRLPELHALACCLKAVVTSDAAHCAERCKMACGGNGYLLSSSLPQLHGQIAAACIYEGENTVLLLQTARFLLKSWQNRHSSLLASSVMYMQSASVEGYLTKWDSSVEGVINGLQVVAVKKISLSMKSIDGKVSSGSSLEDAWNKTSVQLVAAAEAHTRVILTSFFYEGIKEMLAVASESLAPVLMQLLELYTVYWALECLADLLKYTPISQQGAEELQAKYERLLEVLRPNAVGLVDAFEIRDEMIQSTLGANDGCVYERLLEEAKKSTLNKEIVNCTYYKYLKPYMQGKL
ncbi:hypothetical protein ACJJTC_015606 [Scirpophaga incertulas]